MPRPMYAGGPDMNYDVIIIGAGPGGIFAAYDVAGLPPLDIAAQKLCAHKFCTGCG